MAREQGEPDHREASLLDRREVLAGAGGVAAGIGLGVVPHGARAQAAEPRIDVQSVPVDHTWTTVGLTETHAEPVVIAPSLSYRGPHPATPRVRNVTGDAFELSVEEWLYLDRWHRQETAGCLATDAGTYGLADGTAVEVGRLRTNHRWATARLSAPFSSTPVVFSQAQTRDGWQPIVTRHRDVSRSSLEVRLQEEEAQGAHLPEDVGYLAIEPGVGTVAGHAFEAGVHSGVDGSWTTVDFQTAFREPVFLADLQTFQGNDTCAVRYRNLAGSSVEVKVEEERSRDHEVGHLEERIGYLVVEGATGETPLSALDRSRVERLVHRYVNERRADSGLGPLAFDAELREIARYHSEDMAVNDYFGHTAPDGETTSDRYDRFGYDCRADAGDGSYYTGAENIAYTYYDRTVGTDDGTVRYTNADELARSLVRSWMNSEGHRENVLLDAWDDEGVGVAITSAGKVYATQNFC